MPKQPKQTRQSKADIAKQIEQKQTVERQKVVARLIFPAVEQLATVYDAQTVFNAVSGHIKYGLIKAEKKLKVSDIEIDLETGKDSAVKFAVNNILELLRDEPATDSQRLLEIMGSKLSEYLATKHLQDPMSTLKSEDFIAS